MKKHKISIMLNLATLCIALVAVVFGVYSLRQANMNINGSLGFVSHGVKANIVTSITGSVAAANDTYSKTDVFKPSGDEGITLNGDTQEINFTRYFSNNVTINYNPAPIKISFAITNQSNFDIKVDVSTPTLPTGVTMTTDKSSIKIAQNASGNITATFYLDPTSTDFEATALTGLKLELSQYSFNKSDIIVNYNSAGLLSNYYIEYGSTTISSIKYNLKWYIIGTYDSNGQIQKLSTTVSDYLDNGADSSKFKMKEGLTYALMSEYILPTDATAGYLAFNNNCFLDSNGETIGESLEFSGVKANDYSISTVRSYLKGKTVYTETNSETTTLKGTNGTKYTPNKNGASINFFTQNSLKEADIYTLIQARTLGSMYAKMSNSATDIDIPTDLTEGNSSDEKDSFWVLSYNEANTLFASDTNRKGYAPNNSATAVAWFLRTPMAFSSSFWDVNTSGSLYQINIVNRQNCNVRPAFLI